HGGRDRRIGRGGGRGVHRRARLQARCRLHRRLHRPARQDDGPRRLDSLRHRGNRSGQAGGVGGARGAGWPHTDGSSGDRCRDRGLAQDRLTFTSPLAATLASDVLERFQRYVRVDTQSQRDRERSPSTPGQLELGRMLVDELHVAGLTDAALDEHGYVFATLPGPEGSPVIGVLAHMDVSPDAPGDGVVPIVHAHYDGGVIELPYDETVLDPAQMPVLATKVGHDIVTSSGNTLLGADDKAGVAEIM